MFFSQKYQITFYKFAKRKISVPKLEFNIKSSFLHGGINHVAVWWNQAKSGGNQEYWIETTFKHTWIFFFNLYFVFSIHPYKLIMFHWTEWRSFTNPSRTLPLVPAFAIWEMAWKFYHWLQHVPSGRWHENYHWFQHVPSGRWHENYHWFQHVPSGRWHGILNLPPSLTVFRLHVNQVGGSVGVFTMFSKHTTWENTSPAEDM